MFQWADGTMSYISFIRTGNEPGELCSYIQPEQVFHPDPATILDKIYDCMKSIKPHERTDETLRSIAASGNTLDKTHKKKIYKCVQFPTNTAIVAMIVMIMRHI